MIPIECKDDIIQSGMTFIRAITEAYGTDKGMELWEQITDVLDPEVKGQIFFAMITGEYNDRITLKGVMGTNNAVACIKEVRNWTGFGLKEAKDTYDRLRGLGSPEVITVKPQEYAYAVSALRKVGYMI